MCLFHFSLLGLVGCVATAEVVNGSLRLVDSVAHGATDVVEGLLEVLRNSSWSAICDGVLDDDGAAVACRQLGFSHGVSPTAWHTSRPRLTCKGTESTLAECERYYDDDDDNDNNDCHHAHVRCMKDLCLGACMVNQGTTVYDSPDLEVEVEKTSGALQLTGRNGSSWSVAKPHGWISERSWHIRDCGYFPVSVKPMTLYIDMKADPPEGLHRGQIAMVTLLYMVTQTEDRWAYLKEAQVWIKTDKQFLKDGLEPGYYTVTDSVPVEATASVNGSRSPPFLPENITVYFTEFEFDTENNLYWGHCHAGWIWLINMSSGKVQLKLGYEIGSRVLVRDRGDTWLDAKVTNLDPFKATYVDPHKKNDESSGLPWDDVKPAPTTTTTLEPIELTLMGRQGCQNSVAVLLLCITWLPGLLLFTMGPECAPLRRSRTEEADVSDTRATEAQMDHQEPLLQGEEMERCGAAGKKEGHTDHGTTETKDVLMRHRVKSCCSSMLAGFWKCLPHVGGLICGLLMSEFLSNFRCSWVLYLTFCVLATSVSWGFFTTIFPAKPSIAPALQQSDQQHTLTLVLLRLAGTERRTKGAGCQVSVVWSVVHGVTVLLLVAQKYANSMRYLQWVMREKDLRDLLVVLSFVLMSASQVVHFSCSLVLREYYRPPAAEEVRASMQQLLTVALSISICCFILGAAIVSTAWWRIPNFYGFHRLLLGDIFPNLMCIPCHMASFALLAVEMENLSAELCKVCVSAEHLKLEASDIDHLERSVRDVSGRWGNSLAAHLLFGGLGFLCAVLFPFLTLMHGSKDPYDGTDSMWVASAVPMFGCFLFLQVYSVAQYNTKVSKLRDATGDEHLFKVLSQKRLTFHVGGAVIDQERFIRIAASAGASLLAAAGKAFMTKMA